MHKTINRIKSFVLSGAVAVSALAAPLSSNMATPSLTATAATTDDYARLLQYSLYFYDANMCGTDVASSSAITWRGNCHTDDEVPGGFHDAGDHVMFGLPQGYAASTLGWSYYEFKDAYEKTGQGEHLKMITDRFCDFFKRSTKLNGNTVSNFLYQKGSGVEDHKYWGAPEQQGGGRRMYWTSNSASDIAAQYAASLAANYVNFGNAEDLKYAEALYNFSTQYNSIATDGPQEGGQTFYKNGSCQDEQAWAAGWLYLATNNEKYKNDLSGKLANVGWIHGWENSMNGAACLYAKITGEWGRINNYLASNATGSGYKCLDDWGSARLNCSMQMSALVATKNTSSNYADWCKGQMNYILGENPFNTCFVTGFASNSAKNTHHRAASGYQGYTGSNAFYEGVKTYHPTDGKVLIGAITGGPNKAGQYSDVIDDYMCNEVALDYNAALVGAAAGLYSVYGTGAVSSSIEGVDKIYSGSVTPGPGPSVTTTTKNNPSVVTTTTAKPSTGGETVLLPSDMVVGTEEGDDGETNNYAEFAPGSAKKATLYYTVNSTDTESSGAFGTWNGEWVQEDFNVAVKNGKVEVSYDIPSNVGSTVKAMIFWPHGNGVTIDKVVLSSGSSSPSTPSVTTTTRRTTTTTRRTTTTTAKPSSGGNDVVLLPSDMVVDTEIGDDGETNNFAEFSPQGAESATLYYTVKSNDTESAGAFGTWNGEWVQEDFNVAVKNGKVEVSYEIPSNVGSTVKAMVFWPHGNSVTIDKVVLHMADKPQTTTTTRRTTTTTKKTTTTTKKTTTTTTTKKTTTTTTTTKPPVVTQATPGDADCNGKVQLNDAVLILQSIGNPDVYKLTSQGRANSDVCNPGDGITNKDALSIQRYILKLISSLPEYN